MNYFKKNPGARKAYRARWADAWARLLTTGAASPDEEEATRREILKTEAGVDSSNDLTEEGYTKVMLHLGSILGESETKMKNPWRAKRIARIEHLAMELAPENPEAYIVGVLDDMRVLRDPAKWRTGLIDDYLQNTMLTLETQARRVRARGEGSDGVVECGSDGQIGKRGVTPVVAKEKGAAV